MSLIFATQLTAVATAALAVLALAAAVLAGLAYLKQSREVSLLLEQAKRDTDERRRAQAAKVFLGAPPDTGLLVSPYARNASDFPIYDVRIRFSTPSGEVSQAEHLGTIMPGEIAAAERQLPASEAATYTILTFRDAAGIRWIRLPSGSLWEPGSRELPDTTLISISMLLSDPPDPNDDYDYRPVADPLKARATGGRIRRALRAVLPKRRPE